MNQTDQRFLSLLEENNKLFRRIAESLETIALHALENKPQQPDLAISPINIPQKETRDKTNPFYYCKTQDAANDLVKRCIQLAKDSGERIVSSRSVAKMLRHEYNIPEQQMIDISRYFATTFKVCGLTQLSRFIYLIDQNEEAA